MTTDLHADRELARNAASGDESSWRRIFDRTCERLFSLLCYQVGDRDEAKDLLQETYLQAYRRLEGYRGEAPLEVWLRAIALRKACDWKRGVLRRIRRTVPLLEATLTVDPPADGRVAAEERAALRRALGRLSTRQRAALLLRELEERSFAEIAGALGCNESTARVHHTRARQRLRGWLVVDDGAVGGEGWEGQRT
jgi:RNA polymerase sigma-70 factor (ECF subfamily)